MKVIIKQADTYYSGFLSHDEEEQKATLTFTGENMEASVDNDDPYQLAIDTFEMEYDLEIYQEEDFEIFSNHLKHYGKQLEEVDIEELVDLLNNEVPDPDTVVDLTVCHDKKGDKIYTDYKMTIRSDLAEQLESHWFEMLIREDERKIYLYKRDPFIPDKTDYPSSSIYDNESRAKQVTMRCTIKKSVVGKTCWIARAERQMLFRIVIFPELVQ